jgi:hypothetical protein
MSTPRLIPRSSAPLLDVPELLESSGRAVAELLQEGGLANTLASDVASGASRRNLLPCLLTMQGSRVPTGSQSAGRPRKATSASGRDLPLRAQS